jgi:transposase
MVREHRRSRLGRGVQEELIKYFCAGVTARAAAEVSGVNRNTAILFYHKLREVIFDALTAEMRELLAGEIEVDESYFGGHRKAKRYLSSYNGIPRQNFHLFIKECEWRFNYRPIGRMQKPFVRWWFK